MTSLLYHAPSTGNPPSQEPIPGNLHPHPLYSTPVPGRTAQSKPVGPTDRTPP